MEVWVKFDFDKLEMVSATKKASQTMLASRPQEANKGGTTQGIIKMLFEDPSMHGVKFEPGVLYEIVFLSLIHI